MAIIAPEVAPQPIPNVRMEPAATTETFGGGAGLEAVGQQGQKIAADAGAIAAFEKIRADQTAVQEAAAKLSEAHTQILYDPETGVLASRGTNSFQAQKEGWDQYRKTANQISSTLHGEAQVGAFNKEALAMGDTFNRTTMAHVDTQLKEHDKNTFNSLVLNLTDQGAMAYGDPLHRQLLLGMLDDHAKQYARRNGLSDDEQEAMQSKINSDFHRQVIARMLGDRKDLLANQYFTEHKDDIADSDVRDHIDGMLKEGSFRGESLRQADAIWDKAGGNLQDAFAAARKIEDPEVQDRTVQRLRERDNQVKEARTSDQDNAYYDAQKLLGNATKGGRVKGEQSLNDIVPPDVWTRMSPTQQAGLRRLYLGGDENSDQIWTSWSLMSPTEKAGMSQADFQANVLSHLDNKHRDVAMKQFNDALGNKTTALSDHEQVNLIQASAQQSGIIPGLRPGVPAKKLRGDAAASYTAFQDSVQEAVSDFERTTLGGRRRASMEETQKIIDTQTLGLIGNKTSILTTAGRVLGLSTSPAIRYNDIPDQAKEDILSIARHLGKTVTKEQIERAYISYQQKDPKGINAVLR